MAERPSRIRPGIALSFVLWIYGFLLLIPLPPTAWDRVKRYRGVDLGHDEPAEELIVFDKGVVVDAYDRLTAMNAQCDHVNIWNSSRPAWIQLNGDHHIFGVSELINVLFEPGAGGADF